MSDLQSFVLSAHGAATASVTASLAVEDLRVYDGQLATLFPLAADSYPADSLRRCRIARASAWLDQLLARHDAGVQGKQRVALAMVAFAADRDSLARAILDARIAEVPSTPAEQALVLAAGITMFGDTTLDAARLARTYPVVQEYLNRLMALPRQGYRAQSDSEAVALQRAQMMNTAVHALDALRQPDRLVAQLDTMFALVALLPQEDRAIWVQYHFPHRTVASALVARPGGAALVDSLDARLLRLTHYRDNEWPPRIPVARRAAVQASNDGEVRQTFVRFEMLGHTAPPVFANAWLNTPDSAYLPTARSHAFDDGTIRVLAFGEMTDSTLPVIERLHRQFPDVQLLFITATHGHGAIDLLTPQDEVAWLREVFKTRGISTPIAIWAGAKVAQERAFAPVPVPSASLEPSRATAVVSDGHGGATPAQADTRILDAVTIDFQRYLPLPSPMDETYRLLTPREEWLVLDGAGKIRGYQTVKTRKQEGQLIEIIEALRRSSAIPHATPPS